MTQVPWSAPPLRIDAPVNPVEMPRPSWFERDGLAWAGDHLIFAGQRVDELVARHGAPAAFYDTDRITANVRRLHGALEATGQPHQLYYAMKANRLPRVLETVRATGVCGIDCCSPREVMRALEHGFAPSLVSFTGSAVSERDVEAIGGLDIRINVDSISMLHKVGRRFPGRRIGLRVNPQIGVGMSSALTYAGHRPSKFGIYADRFDEARRLADSYGLIVDGVHMHVGSGWLARGLETFSRAVTRLTDFAATLPDLAYVNVGGGIGVPHEASDEPVDLALYASTVALVVRERLGDHVEICCEPGDYIVNDAGILAAEVTMVEEKGGALFVGLNVGFNSNPQAAHYGFHQEIVHASRGPAGPNAKRHFVVGNINEVIDNFHEDAPLPEVHEGDVLVMLNAGGYGASMVSDHCMREVARDVFVR